MASRGCWICGLSALLPLFAAGCGGDSGGLAVATGESGASGTTLGNGSVVGAAGTLVLEAWGGPSGEVATDVPILEPGAGPQETCAAPLNDGACQLTSCKVGGVGSLVPGCGNFGPISASVGATTVHLTYDGIGYGTLYFPSSVTLGIGGTMTFHRGNAAAFRAFDVSATIPGARRNYRRRWTHHLNSELSELDDHESRFQRDPPVDPV